MKKIVAFLTAAVLILSAGGCVDRDIAERFREIYGVERSFEEYCGDSNTYRLRAELRSSALQLYLKKDGHGQWSGSLGYYEWGTAIEKIPAFIDGEELVVCSVPEKRVPMETILLYRHFDADECTVEQALFMSFDHPLEEVSGSCPPDRLRPYAERLYTELFSCLTSFEREDDYFKAVEQLKSYTYNRNLMYREHPSHLLTLGFDGDKANLWDPGFGAHSQISLFLSENTQYIP